MTVATNGYLEIAECMAVIERISRIYLTALDTG